MSWNEFWTKVGEAFKSSRSELGNFWFGGGGNTSPYIANFIFAIAVLLFGYFFIKLFLKLLKKIFKIDKKIIKEKTIKNFILNTLKVLLYFGLCLIVLGILRVNLSGFAEIFSSAILAIGLSLQDVISNFASGIIILSSKPFVIGDYVNIGNGTCEGTVVSVKFLVTCIETVDKQNITIPNKTITSSVVMNYTQNPLRRLRIDIGVDYDTNVSKVKDILINLAKNDNRVLLEPTPVAYLTAFQSSAINISLRCYVPNEVYWNVYFDMNEKIFSAFKKNNIEIPFNRIVVSSKNSDNLLIKEDK